MCGIFGWAASTPQCGQAGDRAGKLILEALEHRGPDDAGFVLFPHVREGAWSTERQEPPEKFSLLLGQTRLSIIDLSPAGHQPMHSADGRHVLVYNGEVYNYLEVRQELQNIGVRFRTQTDTEVVLQALITWGRGAFSRFTGMFALAFLDRASATLILARDHFGIKPLYYHHSNAGLIFASEIPSLLTFPQAPRTISPQAAYSYLCHGHYDMGQGTMLEGVLQLQAGHMLTLQLESNACTVECHWKPDVNSTSALSFADATVCLREMFLQSVRLHLRSDVPVGLALSGGLDSSAIACAVRHLEPDMDVQAFSFLAKDTPLSEEKWVRQIVQHAKARLHEVHISPQDLVQDLETLIKRQGEPFGSTSIYAQYRIFKSARQHGICVMLEGQGADELFAGYHGYPEDRIKTLLMQGRLCAAHTFAKAKQTWPGSEDGQYFARGIRALILGQLPAPLQRLLQKLRKRDAHPSWLDMEALRGVDTQRHCDVKKELLYPCKDKVRQALAYDLTYFGLPHLLRHGDRNAMAFSIENRVPFLTKDMAEFCLSLPEQYLIDMQGRSKSVFREAMRGLVPDGIIDRRDKIGFATPEKQWLQALNPWIEATLSDAHDVPFIKCSAMLAEWNRIKEGQKVFDWRVWRWLNYILWARSLRVGKDE